MGDIKVDSLIFTVAQNIEEEVGVKGDIELFAAIIDRHIDLSFSDFTADGGKVELAACKGKTDRAARVFGKQGDLAQEGDQFFSMQRDGSLFFLRDDAADVGILSRKQFTDQCDRARFDGDFIGHERQFGKVLFVVEDSDHLIYGFEGDDVGADQFRGEIDGNVDLGQALSIGSNEGGYLIGLLEIDTI